MKKVIFGSSGREREGDGVKCGRWMRRKEEHGDYWIGENRRCESESESWSLPASRAQMKTNQPTKKKKMGTVDCGCYLQTFSSYHLITFSSLHLGKKKRKNHK